MRWPEVGEKLAKSSRIAPMAASFGFDPVECEHLFADFLEELLQRPVELVTTEPLSPYIGPRILDEAEYARVA
jgi:hypothetical protein